MRTCAVCGAVIVGACLHFKEPHVESPRPSQFAVPTMVVAASTSSTSSALAGTVVGGLVRLRWDGLQVFRLS